MAKIKHLQVCVIHTTVDKPARYELMWIKKGNPVSHPISKKLAKALMDDGMAFNG
jgi:hypothetical protein